jgi:hypothetical protein
MQKQPILTRKPPQNHYFPPKTPLIHHFKTRTRPQFLDRIVRHREHLEKWEGGEGREIAQAVAGQVPGGGLIGGFYGFISENGGVCW